MSDVLQEFLSSFGFGGAETGADITRMLGVQDPTEQRRFGRGLDPLFATVRTGLGELPGLLSTLTGQVQRRFQTGRAGVQERGVELGRAGRAGIARAGFAGAGALERRGQLGRRQLGRQLTDILGARETGLFGAEQRVESERAGLLGTMGSGIQNLLNALISGGVEFGAEDVESPAPGITTYESNQIEYEEYQNRGGVLSMSDWLAAGKPTWIGAERPGALTPEEIEEKMAGIFPDRGPPVREFV